LANFVLVIFKVTVYPFIVFGSAVHGELEVILLIGGAEEWAAIQYEMSTWLKKRGYGNLFKGLLLSSTMCSPPSR
jgi:hypothetical protein